MRPSDDQLRRLGGTLREIDPSALQADSDGDLVRWFQGERGTEVFAWLRNGEPPHHIQLIFARVAVEWSRQGGLVTGTFGPEASTSGGRYDSYLLMPARTVDPEVCRAALLLLSAAPIDRKTVDPLASALEKAVDPVP